MKRILKSLICLIFAVFCVFSFSACGTDDEEVYSNMTKSGFNNYLTNEETETKFSSYEIDMVEKFSDDEIYTINFKTRTLGNKSIGVVTYKRDGLQVVVHIAQDMVFFTSHNEFVMKNHAVEFDFFGTTDYNTVDNLSYSDKAILFNIRSYMEYIDAQKVYDKIKSETERLEQNYSIKMSIRESYDRYKINYNASEEKDSLVEDYSINTFFEFYDNNINKIEYTKIGKRIDAFSARDYEFKVTVKNYEEPIIFPDKVFDYEVIEYNNEDNYN